MVFGTGPFCCCLCGGFGLSLFFVAPFSVLAVFYGASVFNQDVSTWNTGAVTSMASSKCVLSSFLLATALPLLWCVVEYIYDISRFVGSHVSHLLFFFVVCGLARDLLLLFVWWVWSFSFLCCTLLSSCSVSWSICVQSGRVHLEHRGGDKDGLQ